ncbi:hypothetical protein [Trinickia dinghuensis]|uniref:Uncharacterized protein n=1 Tax=Trinickia dinghuensis TaxID=2291023 RepID=A0A3D8K0L9_9BURK|nr:hypothetical protein [Trinickia dinghuensis]RDU98385.1 hypothetical protein DWV00_13855 [Trinickia dinghuensis]
MHAQSSNPAGPRRVEIRQIFYSEETRRQLDPGFIALDNCGQRPDWREYWPMRSFLQKHTLDENTLYGFFSPKFGQKTSLNSAAVNEFIASVPRDVDVIGFSPFFDQGAIFLNTFEQAATNHANSWPVFEQAVAFVAPGIDPRNAVMDSRHAIFCNYFVATPAFWRRWLAVNEVLFSVAEAGTSALAQLLNGNVPYANGFVPGKVFVQERVVSLLLLGERHWRVRHFDPLRLPMSGSIASPYPADLLVLDALKTAAIEHGNPNYLTMFQQVRNTLLETARRAKGMQ